MYPRVIADSDDESEGGPLSSPPPEPAQAVTTPAHKRSFGQESLATTSTDPGFFQEIYQDQHDAACRSSRSLLDAHDGLREEIDHRQVQATVDPWAVPSDSEMVQIPKAQTKSLISDEAIARALSNNRRRLRSSKQPVTLSSDMVDHVALGSSDHVEHPQDLNTDTAKQTIVQNNNLLLQQQTLYSAGSSGSKTNVNTPRDFTMSSHSVHTTESPSVGRRIVTRKRDFDSAALGMTSSPDVISLQDAKTLEEAIPGPEKPDGEAAAPSTDDLPAALQPDENVANLPAKEETISKPAPKKRKGRPRKDEGTDKTESIEHAAEVAPKAAAKPVEKATKKEPKKKRGRPRKQPPPQSSDHLELALANHEPATDVPEPLVVEKGDDAEVTSMNNQNKPGPHNEVGGAADVIEHDDPKRLPETEPMGQEEEEEDASQSKNNDQDENGKQNAETKNADAGGGKVTTKRAFSASKAAKPPLRVGLSKRSRIAPLLKVVRKDEPLQFVKPERRKKK